MQFRVGDTIKHYNHHTEELPRLVVAVPPDKPDTVIVFDSTDQQFRRAHNWCHNISVPATDASRDEAIRLYTSSEASNNVIIQRR